MEVKVCPNIAEEIIQEVNKIEDYSTIPTTNEDNELITLLDEKVDRAFIDAVKEQVIRQDIIDKVGKGYEDNIHTNTRNW